jgi:hypothetical protein
MPCEIVDITLPGDMPSNKPVKIETMSNANIGLTFLMISKSSNRSPSKTISKDMSLN